MTLRVACLADQLHIGSQVIATQAAGEHPSLQRDTNPSSQPMSFGKCMNEGGSCLGPHSMGCQLCHNPSLIMHETSVMSHKVPDGLTLVLC